MQTSEQSNDLVAKTPSHKPCVCVLLSGGVDSTACVDFYLKGGFEVGGLFIDYGQAARAQEKRSAERVAKHYVIELRSLDITGGVRHSEGLIIGRNAVLFFTALMESSQAFDLIAAGMHAGTQYYDCSKPFIKTMQVIFDGYTSGRVRVAAPFLEWSKLDILDYCKGRNVPISLTYSCEVGGETSCGRCLSCRDLEALRAR